MQKEFFKILPSPLYVENIFSLAALEQYVVCFFVRPCSEPVEYCEYKRSYFLLYYYQAMALTLDITSSAGYENTRV